MIRAAPNILVAHSDLAIREAIVGVFSRAGYNVEQARDHDETLAMLTRGDVDALVVSLRLPPNGCISLLDACYDPPPTIVLGERSSTDMTTAFNDRRVLSVLPRPYKLKDLYDVIETTAGRPRRS
jgi:DNA-binding response OmpR family regulator